MKKTRYILWMSLLMTTLAGCKSYFDLNENPNLISNPPLSSLLTTTTQKTALNSQRVANITSYFVQYLANSSTAGSTDTYQITDYTTVWDAVYRGMADVYDLKKRATDQGASEYVGAADVMMAYHLMLISDLFGDAPYAEAFLGTILTPKYDKAADLYAVATTLLNEGITELGKTNSKVRLSAANDLIHGGKTASWIKTAYALKARLLNRTSKTAAYKPADVLTALGSAYTSNDDDAQMASFQTRNPWAQAARDNAALLLDGWLSAQLVDQLSGKTFGVFDPRIEKITDKTVNNNYVGTVNGRGNVGAANTIKDECYISLNSTWTGETSPLFLVTYAELKFVEAEAAFRSGDKTKAYAAYLAGIQANMDKFGVATAARDAYIANAVVSVGAAALTLDLIFKEKYVATYLNPEAWNDARRFDYQYKGFKLPENAALTTFIRRVAYPSGEISKNGNNVPAEVPLSEPLWWDRK